MNIEFERTLDDMIEFNLFFVDNSPSLRRQVFLVRIVASLMVVVLSLVTIKLIFSNRPFDTVAYFASAIGALFIFVIFPRLNRSGSIRRLKRLYSEANNQAVLGKQTLHVLQDGLYCTNQAGESKIKWEAIDKVATNENYIYLYIGAVNVLIIPRKAFHDAKIENEFMEIVRANVGG